MEKQKIFIKTAYCLVGVSIVVLIGLSIYQHQQIKKATQVLSPETSSLNNKTADIMPDRDPDVQKDSAQNPALASMENQTVNNEADELIYQLEAAEEELDMVQEQLAEEEAKKEETRKIQKELQKQYRENPSYLKSMKNSLNSRYADLFEKLNLSPEKLDKFKDLMVEENMAQQDIYLEYDDTINLSKEERDELNRRYQAVHEEYESKKEDLLSENDFEIYQAYTESEGERYNVNNFMATLGSDEKLTEPQKEELIETMHEASKDVVFERIDDDSESSSNMYSDKNIALMLENYNLRIEAYSKAADSILSSAQLEKFEEYLEKERDEFKLMMEMSALRYGTSTTAESSDNKSE